MVIDRICFEQLFPTGIYANQRFRAEASVCEGEDLTECYKKLQQEVNMAFESMNPGLMINIDYSSIPGHPMHESSRNVNREEQVIPHSRMILDEVGSTEPFDRIQAFIDTINSKWQTKKTLENFRAKVEAENNPELTNAYNNRLKQLKK